jgi:hypothetical protein
MKGVGAHAGFELAKRAVRIMTSDHESPTRESFMMLKNANISMALDTHIKKSEKQLVKFMSIVDELFEKLDGRRDAVSDVSPTAQEGVGIRISWRKYSYGREYIGVVEAQDTSHLHKELSR